MLSDKHRFSILTNMILFSLPLGALCVSFSFTFLKKDDMILIHSASVHKKYFCENVRHLTLKQ